MTRRSGSTATSGRNAGTTPLGAGEAKWSRGASERPWPAGIIGFGTRCNRVLPLRGDPQAEANDSPGAIWLPGFRSKALQSLTRSKRRTGGGTQGPLRPGTCLGMKGRLRLSWAVLKCIISFLFFPFFSSLSFLPFLFFPFFSLNFLL